MKKNINRIMLSAALTGALVSCQKEVLTVEEPAQEAAMDLKASIVADAEDVKSHLDGLTLNWTEGDKIALYQYGKYKTGTNRDQSKNVFTYSASKNYFSGSVKNYHPMETGGALERYYVTYPASSISAFGISTADCTVTIPSEQNGQFEGNAIYFGNIKATSTKEVAKYEGDSLKFLEPFKMYCATPVVKFNVPAALNVTKIEFSLVKEDTLVAIAGTMKCRTDAASMKTKPSLKTITITNGSGTISGDVYVVLAPTQVPATASFKTEADTIKMTLTNTDNGTARLFLPLSETTISCGKIKNLKNLPESLTWEGKGISSIAFKDNSGNAGRYEIFTVNPSATLKYGRSESSFAEAGAPNTAYPSTGIARGNVDYLRLKTSVEGYKDKYENAVVWGFTKSKAFGLYIKGNMTSKEVGYSISQYGLTYTVTETSTADKFPYCKTDGINFMLGGSSTKGYLSFSAPQNGTARLMIQSAGSGRTVTVTNVTKGTSTTKSLGSSQGVVTTDEFTVSANDVIKVEFSASVVVNSISFVWE